MICFLTSRTDLPGAEDFRLNPANGFAERLRRCFPEPCRALDICSDPEDAEKMDFYAAAIRASFEDAGFRFESFRTLDGRNREQAAELVRQADLLILSGGHVPTQNRFFSEIGLKELLRDFDGVLVGISAGSMNSAETVYAHPELPGEALDPAYRRFLPGLGLTRRNILPHYQDIKDDVLDGLRVMEDIAWPDSLGRRFLIFPDGTYLYLEKGRETLCGQAWLLADGELTQLCAEGETLAL
jgi:dipeptidase E